MLFLCVRCVFFVPACRSASRRQVRCDLFCIFKSDAIPEKSFNLTKTNKTEAIILKENRGLMKNMKKITYSIVGIFISTFLFAQTTSTRYSEKPDSIGAHKVVLDNQSRIISWITPQSKAYDQFLHQRWDFIKTRVPNSPGPAPRSSYPQYYFYCAFRDSSNILLPDTWMNDVGEKIPNWFESARLYYAYTGDTTVMTIVKNLIDYTIDHGTSPSNFSWPDFPYTTTNAGDTEFSNFY